MQNIVGQGFTPADSNIRFSARASPCPTKKTVLNSTVLIYLIQHQEPSSVFS